MGGSRKKGKPPLNLQRGRPGDTVKCSRAGRGRERGRQGLDCVSGGGGQEVLALPRDQLHSRGGENRSRKKKSAGSLPTISESPTKKVKRRRSGELTSQGNSS